MNVAKNMEAIFVAALVVAVGVSNAFAGPVRAVEVAADTTVPVSASASIPQAPIATVVVVGKRLSAEQKAKRAA